MIRKDEAVGSFEEIRRIGPGSSFPDGRMAEFDQRRALAVLQRKRLLELIAAYGLEADPSEPDVVLIDILARSRKASFSRILARLEPSELREILRTGGITSESKDVLELRSLILGEEAKDGISGHETRGQGSGRGPKATTFEEELRRHMLEDLGFQSVIRKEWVEGTAAEHGHDCDLHGIKHPRNWAILQRLGAILMALAFLAFLIPGVSQLLSQVGEGVAGSLAPELAGSGLLALGGGSWLLAIAGRRRWPRHVWVECINRKVPVKQAEVLKLVNAVQDATAFQGRAWTPHEIWFASGHSGFEPQALELAREHNVRCFEWEDGRAVPARGL